MAGCRLGVGVIAGGTGLQNDEPSPHPGPNSTCPGRGYGCGQGSQNDHSVLSHHQRYVLEREGGDWSVSQHPREKEGLWHYLWTYKAPLSCPFL